MSARARIPKVNVYLKTALVEAANAASRAKASYLREKFFRCNTRSKTRWGHRRAAIALAHEIRVAIYYMLSRQVS